MDIFSITQSDFNSKNYISLFNNGQYQKDKSSIQNSSKEITSYSNSKTDQNSFSNINFFKTQTNFRKPIKLQKQKFLLANSTYDKKEKQEELKTEEKDVRNLTYWEQENLKYKAENYNMLFSALKKLYTKENSLSKLKELENITSLMESAKNTNKELKKIPLLKNNTLEKFYLKNKQDEGTILMNSLAKTKSRFKYSLFEKKTKNDLTSFNIDIETIDAMKDENLEKTKDIQRDSQNKYYRKLINDKSRQESIMREDLIKIANRINEKKEEKDKIKYELDKIYEKKHKIEEECFNKRNNLKHQILELDDLLSNSQKFFKKAGKKIDKQTLFKNISSKASMYNNLEYEIKELTKESQKQLKEIEIIKNKYNHKLKLINEEQGYLKFVYFSMLQEQRLYYLNILKNGYDVRYEGLVWCVRHLMEMDTNLEYYHFPKFLDHEQIDYLISQSKSYLMENLLSLTLHILKQKQKEIREEEKENEYKKLKTYVKEKEEIKKKEKEKNKKKEPPKPKLNKNDIKSRVLKSYNELYNKYKDAFKFSETTTLNDEEQAKKIFVEIRDSIISKGDYSNHEKENLILKFFEQNPLNKIQLKLIFELREQIKKIQEERYEEKKRMYQKMKERESNLDRYANTKLSVEVDLVFSALFGSNFS
jgi:hypothetical protein